MHCLSRILVTGVTTMLLAGAAAPAVAWGPGGHQAVGAIADQLIAGTPAARKVRLLLGTNLQTASVWADCARAVQSDQGVWTYVIDPKNRRAECAYDENRPGGQAALVDYVRRNASSCAGARPPTSQCRHKAYHFTDLPIQHPAYALGQPGTAPDDLVQTVGALLAVLAGGKSPAPYDIKGQAEALRLLAHFVGDLHQPLHVGAVYLSEAGERLDPATPQELKDHDTSGGNAILFEGRNLHEAWDGILESQYRQALAGDFKAEARQVAATPGAIASWPTAWASETASRASLAFQDLKFSPKVRAGFDTGWPASAPKPAYAQARETLQHEQIVKAGARLAKILGTLWH